MQSDFNISVIIPNYNRSQLLIKAVNSVLAQTFPAFEIIICDDGSTDDSKEKISALNHPNIKWLNCGKNGRPAIPRNFGIKQSNGNWIALLDNDDEWLPNKLETQVNIILSTNTVACCSNANIIKNDVNIGIANTAKTNQTLNFYNLVVSNSIICSTVLVKKELFQKYNFFPEEKEMKALEDYGMWLKIACENDFIFTNQVLINYRDDASQSIRKDSLTTQEQMLLVYKSFKKWYLQNKHLCQDYKFNILKQVLVLRYLTKTQQHFFNFFNR